MKTRSLIALVAAGTLLAGCQGLKDAFTAHVDVVAKAGSQELSVTRLGDLLGHATIQVPATRDVADLLAGYWVDYQLLADAAAKGDSLNSPKDIDAAAQAYTYTIILRKMQAHIDSSNVSAPPTEASYDAGLNGIYGARHILFQFPQGATQAQKDSVKKKAEAILPQVNDKNFADMAKKYSSDGSAPQGGYLGVFGKGEMVPEFYNAVAGLKPGQISKLVETQYGYHIVQRLPYTQAKADYEKQFSQMAGASAERAFMAKLDSGANIQVKPGAAGVAKAAALDASNHRKDSGVLATFNGGTLTVSRMLMWLDQFPPSQRIAQQMQSAPDSLIEGFLKNLATNELLVAKADTLGIKLNADEQKQVYDDFAHVVALSWSAIGVDPTQLADSAKSASDREKLASARVETLMDNMMAGKAQPVPIPTPLKLLLETRFQWKVNSAGLDRATEIARQIRTSADSAKAANAPKSQVPLPGATATPPGGAAPSGGTKKP